MIEGMMIQYERVEIVARAICMAKGVDPDRVYSRLGLERKKAWEWEVERALEYCAVLDAIRSFERAHGSMTDAAKVVPLFPSKG